MLCSYISLSETSLNDNDVTARSCSDIDTCERDIADFTNVSDASDGNGLSALESHASAATTVGEQPDVICQLSATDGLHVTEDDLLHVVSNSHVMGVRNDSQSDSFCAGAVAGDTPEAADISPTHDMCNMSPSLHIGQVGFKAKLRVNVATLSELELWQKEFAERSKTTMRYANVSLCTGKKTLYKVSIMVLYVNCLHVFSICKYKCLPSRAYRRGMVHFHD